MKLTTSYVVLTFITAAFLVSCSNGVSLQRYFVDNQEAKNFISQDVPLSIIAIDKSEFTEEQKEAYNSVSKLNFLGYQADENSKEALKAEIKTIKTILSDAKYKDLMEFNDKGNKILVKYIGTNDQADEVVVFGSSKEIGFGVVRILGSKMNPEKMVTLINAMQKADVDKSKLQDIMNFFQ